MLGIFFLIRLFSFFFTPVTPLLHQNPINTIISVLIFILATYWLIKKDECGWYIIAGEIILGGSGGFFHLFFISLRTALLLSSVTIFFIRKYILTVIPAKAGIQDTARLDSRWSLYSRSGCGNDSTYCVLFLILAAGLASVRGLYMGHGLARVFSDFIPYLFLLYYFPLRELWLSEKFRSLASRFIFVAIIGNALIIIFTQIGFSSGLLAMQGGYYHWYRDVALGKITDLGMNFYRLVLNEHLLLIPLVIYFLGDTIKNKLNGKNVTALVCLLAILANNLTRIYMVALALGVLALFYRPNWKRWLAISVGAAFTFFIIFTCIHMSASRGQSLGWEFFGVRLQSITAPQIEDSSLSRLLLLPKILEKISTHPILGTGLGDTVTVFSPIFKTNITTPNFDWGYLEIYTEMGLLGALAWILIIFYAFKKLIKNSQHIMFAILISFLVINITSPALFHVFGILLITTMFL